MNAAAAATMMTATTTIGFYSSSPLINSHGQEQIVSARASGAMAPKIMRDEGNVQKENRGKQKSKKKQRIKFKGLYVDDFCWWLLCKLRVSGEGNGMALALN